MTTVASPPPVSPVTPPRLPTAWATRSALRHGLDHRVGITSRLREYDVVQYRAGLRRFTSVRHPDYIDRVLHADREHYHKDIDYETLRAVLGVSLFTDEDESWRAHRSLMNPMFSKRRVDGLFDLVMEPIVGLADQLERRDDTEPLRLVEAMVDVTLNVVGNALFSHAFGKYADGMARNVTAALRTAEFMEHLILTGLAPRPALRALVRSLSSDVPMPPGMLRTAQHLMHGFDDAVWSLIDERLEHPTESADLLNLLLATDGPDGRPLPRRRVRDEALTFMLAGHETTANAMSWMWYLLAITPEARERLHAEVDTVLGGRLPTLDDIPKLEYTRACVEESMRYYSPAWIIPRLALDDHTLIDVPIRKGSSVLIPVHWVHHDERWWPEPERYRPERFLGDAGKDRPRSAYLPFGGGRRVCIGRSFALMEAVLITAVLAQRFQFDLVPGHPVDPEATLTLRPRHGIRVYAKARA